MTPKYKGHVLPLSDVKPGMVLEFHNKAQNTITPYGYAIGRAPDYMVVRQCIIKNNIIDISGAGFYVSYPTPQVCMLYSYPDKYEVRELTGTYSRRLKRQAQKLSMAATMIKYSITSGSDPEIFVEKDGQVVPAWTFLKDKTKAPNVAYWDGFQAEFNPIAKGCLGYFADSIQSGLYNLYTQLPKGAVLSTKSVIEAPQEILEKAEEKYVQFGCMPSENAYGLEGFKGSGRETNIRFAGGHIHFGIEQKLKSLIPQTIRAMDALCGVACVSLFAEYDHPVRRRFYGLAGEYRTPAHGLEYRTLSNAWLIHPTIYYLTFEVARAAAQAGLNLEIRDNWSVPEERTIQVIQDCDVEGARKILTDHRREWLDLISNTGIMPSYGDKVHKAYLKGINGLIESRDIAQNWHLNTKKPWPRHGSMNDPEPTIYNALGVWASGNKV